MKWLFNLKRAYFKGFAKALWPKVEKLVSWLDTNEAKDDTLTVTWKFAQIYAKQN
jgi:hypothetical protein